MDWSRGCGGRTCLSLWAAPVPVLHAHLPRALIPAWRDPGEVEMQYFDLRTREKEVPEGCPADQGFLVRQVVYAPSLRSPPPPGWGALGQLSSRGVCLE